MEPVNTNETINLQPIVVVDQHGRRWVREDSIAYAIRSFSTFCQRTLREETMLHDTDPSTGEKADAGKLEGTLYGLTELAPQIVEVATSNYLKAYYGLTQTNIKDQNTQP